MGSVWALQDAKSRFSAFVDRAVAIEPQIVTRRGTPVAVLISYDMYKSVAAADRSVVDVLLGGPRIEGGLDVSRDKAQPRVVEFS